MEEIRTEITIDAPPTDVWGVLTNFERYPEWNPSLSVEGPLETGEQLEVTFTYADRQPTTVRPTLVVVDEPTELRWRGRFLFSGLYDAEHWFLLHPLEAGERTRLVHAETFRGVLVGFVNRRIGRDVETGFTEMNACLKRRVETVAVTDGKQHAQRSE